ncbi:MAG: alpha/beta hydrolase-fold protein [Terriglobales bacterium]
MALPCARHLRLALLGFALAGVAMAAQAGPRFEVSIPATVHAGPFTGRILVVAAKTDTLDPRLQILSLGGGPPMFGTDAKQLAPGVSATINSHSDGYPVASLAQLAPGVCYVESFAVAYREFDRADGHTVWLHSDWMGNFPGVAPGTLYSTVTKMHLDPAQDYDIRLRLDHVLTLKAIRNSPLLSSLAPPQPTPWINVVKLQSAKLTRFWGQPMYLGATVLLPKGYAQHPHAYYPVVYNQGHFNQAIPWDFSTIAPAHPRPYRGGTGTGYQFYQAWNSDHFPRFILVTWQHPCPYFDDSYAVNSANCGPFGDALMQELVPYIESHFRIIPHSFARILEGGSTGGWESLALQLQHPDFFGGAWVFCPDPVDFRAFQQTDLYHDANAFTYAAPSPWFRIEKPWERTTTGLVRTTEREMSQNERVLASHGRSDFQLDGWWAIFDPMGADGYPVPMWDMQSGVINRTAADYAREHGYDLSYYLRTHWTALAPLLHGKLHFFVGDMDNYYLNLAVYRVEDFLKATNYGGAFAYGRPMQGHGWHPVAWADLLREIAAKVRQNAPAGADTAACNY